MADELTGEEKLLKEIRDDFSYFRSYWRENYEEAKTDLRYVSGDPWEPEERKAREDNGRPVLSPDELDQYLNATINNLRQNPLGIKVEPKGEGATDENAQRRQSIIRNIEYDSIAQSAYRNAYSGAITCGFGFFRVTTKKVSKDDEVEPRIKIIGNPLSVLMDPNAKESDFSDQKRCFVIDVMRKADFERNYPNAKKQSFSPDDMQAAGDWFEAENNVVAEYWRIDGYDEDGQGGTVTQYITNGVEILDKTKWPGSKIPIIPVLGKETYVPKGGKMARMFYSMIRKARGPQMMLAYLASQEAEEYGMAPRAPFVGYVGQFDTDKDAWDTLNKVPRAYVQVDAVTDEGNGQLLPLPTRPAFIPNAQAYEIGKESWRRAIQASMGITPLPTSAQRQNEKSGVALERIQTQQAVGAYHFTDNFKLALQNAGAQINELITEIIDTPRQIAGRGQDDEQKLMHVIPGGKSATPLPENADTFDPQEGEFDVTISSGPSYQSQREAASQFADLLVTQIDAMPIAPPQKAALLSLSVKLKNIGPLGDQMAKILDPQGDGEPVPPQAQQAIAQLQEQLKALNAACQHYEQVIQQMQMKQDAKVVDNEAKMAIEKMKIEAQVAVAEISTKAQNLNERIAFVEDLAKQFHAQAHDQAMQAAGAQQQQQAQAQQAGHQQDLQAQQAATQSQQSAQDAQQSQEAQPSE